MANPIISFKNYTFQYSAQKKPTLYDINLDIYPGEKILICGPSGSGKSTLGNCINGLIPFSYEGKVEGSLTVDGVDASKTSIFELSNHVGTVLQDPDGQFIGLTVGEDISFALENDCVKQKEMHDITRQVAATVGIDKHLEKAPHELSGGQKQRVSLAGVMVDDVKILLFDEPLANLDPATGKSAIELIDRIQKETDTTVVIIEHRLEDVLWRHVDRIILMVDGKIVADKTPNDLLSTNLLTENGIREPLYLTSLKYAGVGISEDINPEHIDSLSLNDSNIQSVNNWFNNADKSTVINNNDVILEVKDLHFGYDKKTEILHGINLQIKKGEMISIVGQNGAGKSTFAKVVCGFENNHTGEILFNGRDISKDTIRQRAKHIGYCMQNPNQMISKTMIFDEVALGLQKTGLTEEEIKEKVYSILKVCGLYEFRNWPINALSFGQKKRVTIAALLVMGPEVIILDEPTAGQDFKHYTEIMEFLKEINKQGITVIMITHDMHLMLEYTDRAIAFCNGQAIMDTTPSAVLCNKEIVEKADLKETSLFNLAKMCNIEDPIQFVDCFINYDREVRHNG